MSALPILGGVGLGMCSACNAPGAFWYPRQIKDYAPWLGLGVWMCDSCQWPAGVRARIDRDLRRRRVEAAYKVYRDALNERRGVD